MDNDDLREDEKKSLLDEMSKKGISKKIKTIPLGTKVLIISIFGIVIFLLVFTVLSTVLSMLLLFDFDGNENSAEFTYISNNSEDNYWWPIGGKIAEDLDSNEYQYATGEPTSVRITSNFTSSRTINSITKPHYGIDIGAGTGYDFIIASAQGVVYRVGNGCDNNGYYGNKCHDGLGNYIIIEHPGSVYTMYAHLYPYSITVSKGDSVKQGQIIGKMGNSGSSTGTHLHFQIEVGGRSSANAVNPLEYVSPTNPRPKTVISGTNVGKIQLLSMLQSWEGTGPTEGNYYIVYDDGYGTLTVGHGVTLNNHVSRFEKRNVNISTLSKGSKLDKSIVDDIELEIVNEFKDSVNRILNKNNIILKDYQIDALTIRMYNTGNINNFPDNYNLYGSTQSLYDNYMSKPTTSNGITSSGLARRRYAEWNLFSKGIYTYNS